MLFSDPDSASLDDPSIFDGSQYAYFDRICIWMFCSDTDSNTLDESVYFGRIRIPVCWSDLDLGVFSRIRIQIFWTNPGTFIESGPRYFGQIRIVGRIRMRFWKKLGSESGSSQYQTGSSTLPACSLNPASIMLNHVGCRILGAT